MSTYASQIFSFSCSSCLYVSPCGNEFYPSFTLSRTRVHLWSRKKTIHSHKITALWSNTLFTQSQYSIFLSCISMWILMGMNGWKRNLHYLIHAFISGSKRRPIREGWTQFGCNRADLWPFCSTPPYCQLYVHSDNTKVGRRRIQKLADRSQLGQRTLSWATVTSS